VARGRRVLLLVAFRHRPLKRKKGRGRGTPALLRGARATRLKSCVVPQGKYRRASQRVEGTLASAPAAWIRLTRASGAAPETGENEQKPRARERTAVVMRPQQDRAATSPRFGGGEGGGKNAAETC